jgi:DNA-binding NarL/FixJ family response regulator
MSIGTKSDCPADKPSVLIVDTKRLRQAGIVRLLEAWADCLGLALVGISQNKLLEGLELASSRCEMVIISVGSTSVEDNENQECIKQLHIIVPCAPLVILSDREDAEEVYAAFRAGAIGFVPTSSEPSAALQALSFVKCGGPFFPTSVLSHVGSLHPGLRTPTDNWSRQEALTTKQEEVMRLIRQGETNKLIARHLGMSEATVKVHVRRIMRKLGVSNRTQVAISSVG